MRSGWTGSPPSSRRALQTAEHVSLEILDIFGGLKLRDPELGCSANLVLYVHASHLSQNVFVSYLHGSHRAPELPPCSFGLISFLPTMTAARGRPTPAPLLSGVPARTPLQGDARILSIVRGWVEAEIPNGSVCDSPPIPPVEPNFIVVIDEATVRLRQPPAAASRRLHDPAHGNDIALFMHCHPFARDDSPRLPLGGVRRRARLSDSRFAGPRQI